MTEEQILQEVLTSNFQPEYKFTDDLDAVVDSILKPHEDYFLGLHGKVEEIIEREIDYAKTIGNYQITFADVCNWQKELFEHKREKIAEANKILFMYENKQFPNFSENHQTIIDCRKANKLPNQYINLGLRQTNVKVGKWTPPAPMFIDELKEMCFPIEINDEFLTLPSTYDEGLINGSKVDDGYLKYWITEWYKIFETIAYMEDFNCICGNVVINIVSYILTNKYLIYGGNLETYTY